MKIARQCRVCKRGFRSSKHPDHPARHCANQECSWCAECVAAKAAECKGR